VYVWKAQCVLVFKRVSLNFFNFCFFSNAAVYLSNTFEHQCFSLLILTVLEDLAYVWAVYIL